MVLVCLFTGDTLINQTDRTSLGEEAISTKLLLKNENIWNHHPWADISSRPKDLIRKLLTLDPEQRINATHALSHPWFHFPAWVGPALESIEASAYQFWKPRHMGVQLIQELSDVTLSKNICRRISDKLPDATTSAFFGLDKRLNPLAPRKEKKLMMLEKMHEAGSKFVVEDSPQKESRKRRRSHFPVKAVDGKNIFHSAMATQVDALIKEQVIKPLAMQDDSECKEELMEENFVENSIHGSKMSEWERISKPLKDVGEQIQQENPVPLDPAKPRSSFSSTTMTRSHSHSTTSEDQRVYNEASNELPRITTARLLKYMMATKRGEKRVDST
jgi:serine/threonine protein kinase